MKTIVVETSPITNLKVGSKKVIDNGLATLIKLLVLAVVFYVLYQVLVLLAIGDRYQDLINAFEVFNADSTQTTQLKDALIEFGRHTGAILLLSWLVIGILSLVYNVASMRVYINSVNGKDTPVNAAVRVGFERIGVSILFGLYVSVIVLGYLILATMLSAFLPVLLIVILPLSFVLLAMLIARVLYSYQILSDVSKPKVLSIFDTSKQLVKKSGTALFLYVLLALGLSIIASTFFGIFAGIFGAESSNNYNLATESSDVVYNSVSFVIFAILGIFLNAGWVEIYNQAKLGLEPAQASNKPVKAKTKK